MDISVMIDNFIKWYSDKIKESNTRKELEVLSDKGNLRMWPYTTDELVLINTGTKN